MWLKFRGYVAGVGAFLVCPCHLPLTLPLILTLTAGTAVGGWLANNTILIYIAAAAFFISGLAMAGKWLLVDTSKTCTIQPKEMNHEQI